MKLSRTKTIKKRTSKTKQKRLKRKNSIVFGLLGAGLLGAGLLGASSYFFNRPIDNKKTNLIIGLPPTQIITDSLKGDFDKDANLELFNRDDFYSKHDITNPGINKLCIDNDVIKKYKINDQENVNLFKFIFYKQNFNDGLDFNILPNNKYDNIYWEGQTTCLLKNLDTKFKTLLKKLKKNGKMYVEIFENNDVYPNKNIPEFNIFISKNKDKISYKPIKRCWRTFIENDKCNKGAFNDIYEITKL